jgi:hypothetical protein
MKFLVTIYLCNLGEAFNPEEFHYQSCYEMEVESKYGLLAHLYSMAALFDYAGVGVGNSIEDQYFLEVILPKKKLIYQAKLVEKVG